MPPRRLAPGFGGVIRADLEQFVGRLRYAVPFEHSVAATSSHQDRWVATISAEARAALPSLRMGGGSLRVTAGIAFEEFARLVDSAGPASRRARLSRTWPTLRMSWQSLDQTLKIEGRTYDGALRAGVIVRLSRSIWLDLRLFEYGLLRDRAPFEPSSGLFLTPTIKF